ncbi:hypothetical protein I4U23_005567 [Adineta vaga]|nr:hypothetical protein I4U23_005567 [Adineta vaga]
MLQIQVNLLHPIMSQLNDQQSPKFNNNSKRINLEQYTLIYVDSNHRDVQANQIIEMRNVVDYVQTFDNNEVCLKFMQTVKNEYMILIVSDLNVNIIPIIHEMPLLKIIYILSKVQIDDNNELITRFSKVSMIVSDLFEILIDVKAYKIGRLKADDMMSMHFFDEMFNNDVPNSDRSTQKITSSFLWYENFMNTLLDIDKDTSKMDFIKFYKNYYRGNEMQESLIQEFELNYRPENAFYWYTNHAFFFEVINKAFRLQNVDIIFKLRYFIADLVRLLKNEHSQTIITLKHNHILTFYRGQAITHTEFRQLKNNISEYVKDRAMAVAFARSSLIDDTHTSILFEIVVNTHLTGMKRFADISKYSRFSHENEVLFSIGSVFDVIDFEYVKAENIWLVKLELCDEHDYELITSVTNLRAERDGGTYKSYHVEDHFNNRNKNIVQYYNHFYTSTNTDRNADVCMNLGMIAMEDNNLDLTVKYCTEGLEILSLTEKTCFSSEKNGIKTKIVQCHRQLGRVYLQQDQYKQALKQFKLALEHWHKIKEVLVQHHKTYSYICDDIGMTYYKLGNYNESLKRHCKALKHRLKHEHNHQKAIAYSYNQISLVYGRKNDFEKARIHAQKALNIWNDVIPQRRRLIDVCVCNVFHYDGRCLRKKRARFPVQDETAVSEEHYF